MRIPPCAAEGPWRSADAVDAAPGVHGVRAIRSRLDLRHGERSVWRRGPRRDGDGHQPADAGAASRGDRFERLLHLPEPAAREVRCHGRAGGLQEGRARQRAARRDRRPEPRLHARGRRDHRAGHGHGRAAPAAVRCRAQEDGRVQGHRAARLRGPEPDRRGRSQGRGHRRQLQQLRLLQPEQRRLQHQRQPQRREQHHGRWRHGNPHAVVGRDRGRPEHRRHPGSAGADGRLHAGVRARQRRPDPHGHQERQQPVQRQRIVLLPR